MFSSTPQAKFFRYAFLAVILAYCVVLLGAYTRLSDAGLGCPDWPGCYGQAVAPTTPTEVAQADRYDPAQPVNSSKAWKEMAHRYLAGILVLVILRLGYLGWQLRKAGRRRQFLLSLGVIGFVVVQAILGMLTVTLKLTPLIVVGHLVSGMSLLGLLWWMTLREQRFWPSSPERPAVRTLRPLALVALVLVICQIALGGWTSANYSALVCPDFPTCQGAWWPHVNFAQGFSLWHGPGVNPAGAPLSLPAATAIQMAHRLGALVVFLYVGWLALYVIRVGRRDGLYRYGLAILVALLAQVALGITNVLARLPLSVAIAHDAGAALLLLTLVTLNHAVRPSKG